MPAVAALGVTLGIKLLAAQFQPQWIWIFVALVASYMAFCGLSLIFGLDDDDKIIVTAVRGRIRGAFAK